MPLGAKIHGKVLKFARKHGETLQIFPTSQKSAQYYAKCSQKYYSAGMVWVRMLKNARKQNRLPIKAKRRKDIMTEEQRIAAIDALAEELLFRWKSKTFSGYSNEAKECLRTSTLKQLRVLHADGNLNEKDVYEFLITGFWHNATEGQKLKCENAVQAMRETLKEEKDNGL